MAYHLALQLGDMGDWKYCVLLVLQVASAFHLALQILKMWGRDMAYHLVLDLGVGNTEHHLVLQVVSACHLAWGWWRGARRTTWYCSLRWRATWHCGYWEKSL